MEIRLPLAVGAVMALAYGGFTASDPGTVAGCDVAARAAQAPQGTTGDRPDRCSQPDHVVADLAAGPEAGRVVVPVERTAPRAHPGITPAPDAGSGDEDPLPRSEPSPKEPADDGAPERPPSAAEEEPVTEEPGTEEPGTEEPVAAEPGTEEPVAEEPVTEEPVTDPVTEPVTEPVPEPVTEQPVEQTLPPVEPAEGTTGETGETGDGSTGDGSTGDGDTGAGDTGGGDDLLSPTPAVSTFLPPVFPGTAGTMVLGPLALR